MRFEIDPRNTSVIMEYSKMMLFHPDDKKIEYLNIWS